MQHCNTVFYLFRTSSIWGQNNRINHMDNLGVLPRKWSTDGGWIPYANGLIYQSFQPGSMVFTMFLPQDFWGGSTVHVLPIKKKRFGDMMCCLTGASQQLVNSSNLLGGWPTPLKNHGVCQLGLLFPIHIYIYIYIWKNKIHVPNHQPDIIRFHWWNIHDHMKKKPGIQMALSENRVPTNRLFSLHFPNIKMASREIYPFFRPTSK